MQGDLEGVSERDTGRVGLHRAVGVLVMREREREREREIQRQRQRQRQRERRARDRVRTERRESSSCILYDGSCRWIISCRTAVTSAMITSVMITAVMAH